MQFIGIRSLALCAIMVIGGLHAMEPASGAHAATRLQIYPVAPDERSDGKVSATVNDHPVTFEYFRNFPTYYYDTNYCRFAADGPVEVALTIRPQFEHAFLRGLLTDIPYRRDGNTLHFTLPGPGHYYLQLPDLLRPIPGDPDSGTYTVAFWIDDLHKIERERMNPDDDDVTVVTESGVVSDPQRDQTRAIQAILDQGGRIYFPAGIYRAGTLHVKGETELYLAPGALLKAAPDRDAIDSRFLYVFEQAHVRIHGPGTIDANYDGYPRETENIHIIDVEDSHHIALEDVCWRNCNSWAVHLYGVDQAYCRNIRILSGKDGIDPDSASDVRIEEVFIQAKDDAVAVKTRKPPKPTERVVIRNSIVASDASALKIGTETRALMRDITFENCDVFDSDRGLILYARDGGPIQNVTWRNIRLFMIDWPHETGGAPIQLFITRRHGLTPVRNLVIDHINANVISPIGLAALAAAPLQGARLANVTLRVDPPRGSASYFRGNIDAYTPRFNQEHVGERPYVFKVGNHVKTTVDGLTIDWQGNRAHWAGLFPRGGEGLSVDNLIQFNQGSLPAGTGEAP